MTGGRLLQIGKYLTAGEPFCMTYGDGLSNIDIGAEIALFVEVGHRKGQQAFRNNRFEFLR